MILKQNKSSSHSKNWDEPIDDSKILENTRRARRILVMVVAIISLALVVFGINYYRSEENLIRVKKYAELAAIAELKIGQIVQWRQERLDDARLNSSDPFLGSISMQWMENPQDLSLRASLLERLRTIKEIYKYKNVMIVGLDGQLLLSAEKASVLVDTGLTGLGAAEQELALRAISSDQAVFGDFVHDADVVYLDVAAPIHDEKEQPGGESIRPLAALILRLDPEDYLYPLIQSWPTPSESAETLLVRRDGDYALYLNMLRHRTDKPLSLRVALTNTDVPAVQAVLGRTGIFEGRDYRGVQVLAELRPVPDSTWFMIAKVSTAEILSEVSYHAQTSIFLAGLAILLTGSLAAFIYTYRQRYFYQKLFHAEQEQRRTQDDAREKESLLRALIDHAPFEIWARDKNGVYILENPILVRRLGSSLGETDNGDDGVTSDELNVWQKANRTAYAGKIADQEVIYKADGSERYFHSIVAPIFDGQSVRGIVGFNIDITERKLVEKALAYEREELTRSNAELEQFAYVASHDLQEPLRMVSSYMQLIERRYKGKLDQDADEFIGYAVDGAIRMQRLINDLLMFSRVGTRGKQLVIVSSEEAFAQAVRNLQMSIEENNAEVTHDPLPDLMADKSQLTQLFQNLIGNAIKFHGEQPPRVHGSVDASASDQWVFALRDNGIGIDPQYSERIFVLFQRLHGRSDYPGTGIGLAICRKIVQRHGGRIWVESQPGQGSTFMFTIPRS